MNPSLEKQSTESPRQILNTLLRYSYRPRSNVRVENLILGFGKMLENVQHFDQIGAGIEFLEPVAHKQQTSKQHGVVCSAHGIFLLLCKVKNDIK